MSQEEQEQQQHFFGPKIFSDQSFVFKPKFFQAQFFFVPKFFSDPTFISGPNFFGPKIFLDPKFFLGQNFFPNKNFFLSQNNFWTHFFLRPKTMFGGRKQSCWSLIFLNWQMAKVLLKLEFDTEDQVLLLVNDLFIAWTWLVYDLFVACSWLVHDFSMPLLQLLVNLSYNLPAKIQLELKAMLSLKSFNCLVF